MLSVSGSFTAADDVIWQLKSPGSVICLYGIASSVPFAFTACRERQG
jgi:hypothetical protein